MIRTENLIVGAGLFGSIIAAALRRAGQQTLVIADQRKGMGSRPAACLMKPSWLSSLSEEQRRSSLGLLDELYGLQTLRFEVGLAGLAMPQDVHWVDPAKVLVPPDVLGKLESFGQSAEGGWEAEFAGPAGSPIRIRAKRLVLALGIWQNAFQPKDWPLLKAQHGMAVLLPGKTLEQPFIRPWAPYRQIVAFNRGDGLWVGDGSAISGKTWSISHEINIRDRCLKAVGMREPVPEFTCLHGIRPYSDNKPCLLSNPHSGLWFASGGAKNGTAAAGWCASVIRDATT